MKMKHGARYVTMACGLMVVMFGIALTAEAQTADFTFDPANPDTGDTVTFTITGTGWTGITITSATMNYGDGTPPQSVTLSIDGAGALTGSANHVYNFAGVYTVRLTINYTPPGGSVLVVEKEITVARPAASITIADALPDTHSLLPLQNWSPLFTIEMAWSSEDAGSEADRNLVYLEYEIIGDPKSTDDRGYGPLIRPAQYHFLEFALLRDFGTEDEPEWRVLYVWDNTGAPLQRPPGGGWTRPHSTYYAIDFGKEYRTSGDFFPVPNSSEGIKYMVAVRTSVRWHNGLAFAYKVNRARMEAPNGDFPLSGDPPAPVDSYSPNFYATPPENLNPETAYSASFAVYDVTGSTSGEFTQDMVNFWNWTTFIYAPLPEFTRPRWDAGAGLFDSVYGQRMELRRLFSVETWTAAVGINIHATDQSWMEFQARRQALGAVALTEGTLPDGATSLGMVKIGAPIVREVSVIATDEGADPLGPPGNGGFNPSEGLDMQTFAIAAEGGGVADPNGSNRHDHAFNGIWLWHDGNNNSAFDRPTPNAGGAGVAFPDDHPAFPRGVGWEDSEDPVFFFEYPWELYFWEWVPFPSTGAYPWWRIKLALGEIRETGGGRIEPSPDGEFEFPGPNAYYPDYFITIRPDSGYSDSSTDPGDGTGITLGADTKINIEPRDPANPFRGGILATCQIPLENVFIYGQTWESDPRWNYSASALPDQYEPWWPQRTQNLTNTKAIQCGVDIHDLVMTYDTYNDYGTRSDFDYIGGPTIGVPGTYPNFASWLDPFLATYLTFFDGYSVGVRVWHVGPDSLNIQQPYESAPFWSVYDTPPFGPRSHWLQNPPPQPNRPDYWTWPAVLAPGQYPQEANWPLSERAARKLIQRVDANSVLTAMLGFNVTGANDPRVAQFQRLSLKQITVAFWGPDLDGDGAPDFQPSDLKPLDPKGLSPTSGVALFNDRGDGVFNYLSDSAVELVGLAWAQAPEYVDLDGDQLPDDLNDDGVINALDKAWVLRLSLVTPWRVPAEDVNEAPFARSASAKTLGAGDDAVTIETDESGAETYAIASDVRLPGQVDGVGSIGPAWSKHQPVRVGMDAAEAEMAAESAALRVPGDEDAGGNAGDDLFLVVRTSDTIPRFRKFKAMVPGWLPERPAWDQEAGVQFDPQNTPSIKAYEKHHPEENVGQSFFEHELLEANVPVKVNDLTGSGQILGNTGQPTSVLGLDISTNRGAAATAASGASGTGGPGTFTVSGASWAAGAFVGFFLVDNAYESYEITANTSTQLTLRSGTPRSGAWRIVKDPTFLEQVIVELYPEAGSRAFNIRTDLKPLNIDPTVSGVALYRDNDNNPGNRNGLFDPDIDIPIPLDYAPFLTGQQGEPPIQVMFVLSSPGTDDVPLQDYPSGLDNQPRRRQIVPDSFGAGSGDPDTGNDFFVVLRASGPQANGVAFRAAIVSWGPSTPTEPDPDTFPPPPLGQNGEFDIFSEFPWGYRALGFITFFQDIARYNPLDTSGYNWIRSTSGVTTRTNVLTIGQPTTPGTPGTPTEPTEPSGVVITGVSPGILPTTIPAGGIQLTIIGSGFGTAPTATINSVALTVNSATNTQIVATIPAGTVLTAPVTLTVTNTATLGSATWTSFTLVSDAEWATRPQITAVSPTSGTSSVFPVTITGLRFDNPSVTFDSVAMPVVSWSATQIVVAFPISGLPRTGPLDVKVTNQDGLFDVKFEAFCYQNPPASAMPISPCFIATAAYGTPFEARLDTFRSFRDSVLLKSSVGTALVSLYYTVSPPIADVVAERPALKWAVRLVLTPVAATIDRPAWLLVPGLMLGLWMTRRRIARRKASPEI